jgi:hypothetical protein
VGRRRENHAAQSLTSPATPWGPPSAVEHMRDSGMRLRRTRAGWEEPRPPRVCEACAGALGPNTVLVGIAHSSSNVSGIVLQANAFRRLQAAVGRHD